MPSKFCAAHQDPSITEIEADLPPEFFYWETKETDLISEKDPSMENVFSESCKQRKDVSLFFETTAGMLAFIRPCGIVVDMCEMFTSESYTQVFLFILRTFCGDVEDIKRLKFLGYDRACGLVPFLRNQTKNGSAGAKVLLENVDFLVDIFHVSKHTQDVCMPLNNPNCKFHPLLPKFHAIKGTNTESCEQGFKRLNNYMSLTRKMTQYKRNVLFYYVNDCFNNDLEREMKIKNLLF